MRRVVHNLASIHGVALVVLLVAGNLALFAATGPANTLPANGLAANTDATADSELRWTPEFSMQFRQIGDTVLSDDGSMVAFTVREAVMEEEKSEYRSQIWLGPTEGDSGPRQFTFAETSSTAPQFSPDGQWLAFLSKRGDSEVDQLYLMPTGGGEGKQITSVEGAISQFQFSPNGESIALVMSDPKSDEEKAREKEKRDVILVNQDFKYNHVHIVATSPDDGGEYAVTRLTEGSFHVNGLDWSPDGKQLVISHQEDPRINTATISGDLSLVDVDSKTMTPLVTMAGQDGSPSWSPDGKTIAFVSDAGNVERVGLGDIFVVPATGGEAKTLAKTPDRSVGWFAWASDSSAVVLSESYKTTAQLFRLPADGSEPEAVTDVKGVIGAPAISGDGTTLAFTYEDPSTPEELFVSKADSKDRRQLTEINSQIEMPELGRSEVVTWRSKDGRYDIDGILTYPVGYQSGQRVPLILNVHGGPAGVFSQSFTGGPAIYMIQTFAQEGYAVLRPNPRGSTGYGRDFRYANVKDWGFGDFDDLMAGVDKAIADGIADPERLYVMGWSYGGYMTSWVVTATDRFKAASMGAGLPNLVSMVHTSDIPDYLVAHLDGKELWEDYDEYEKHSAMYRLKNVKTPTQVIHGAQDLRVPFTQGQEFFVGLERLGVPTEMVVYPRTPHGPTEPKFLMDVTGRILTWFRKFEG